MIFCGFCHKIERLFRTSLAFMLAALTACAGTVPLTAPAVVPPPSAPVASPQPVTVPEQIYHETGTASWYGRELHGKKTASGEVFDMYGLSAAHRTLPFGTIVRVTNLNNFKSVKVKVNDRGPFVKNRIIELSYGAAKELGFVRQGTALVKIETLETVRDPAHYTVQAGVYTEEENARILKQRLSKKFEMVFIVPFETNVARFYSVRIGSYPSEERAEKVASKLMLEGLEPAVIRKDR